MNGPLEMEKQNTAESWRSALAKLLQDLTVVFLTSFLFCFIAYKFVPRVASTLLSGS